MTADNTARIPSPLGDDFFASVPGRLPREGERERQRDLRLVTGAARRRRPRMLYGVIAVSGAVLIGAVQMGLSILTTQTSYEISSLSQQQRQLTWQKQIIQDDLAGLASPQYLAANATALGMVIAESPSYLRLSDGAVLGAASAAGSHSNVDALGRAAVANSLVAGVPLVTDPDASLASGTSTDELVGADRATPPPIADGLPAPSTH
ncbi:MULTISPECIES: hypothetical protein [Microbacterium]|uniref:hypothetical protein n=1 Tax=Microbacterium TaxID=33882 RepID=UPI000E718DFD|nr:hypothetical protein [Microbacterium sp. AG238]MDF2579965.1 hypothetical protein [Microbacterium sp.]RKE63540.1 hypothetical protein DEU36_0751 [Microbacterium sp. AG238]